VRACKLIEEYEPYSSKIRFATSMPNRTSAAPPHDHVPLTHGEEWGQRWDFTSWLKPRYRLHPRHDSQCRRAYRILRIEYQESGAPTHSSGVRPFVDSRPNRPRCEDGQQHYQAGLLSDFIPLSLWRGHRVYGVETRRLSVKCRAIPATTYITSSSEDMYLKLVHSRS